MTKRKPLQKHTGVSGGSYNYQQETERKKKSIGFNLGDSYGKHGRRVKSYYVTADNWHHKQLTHGPAHGYRGVKEAKKFTHSKYPHTWMKFKVQKT